MNYKVIILMLKTISIYKQLSYIPLKQLPMRESEAIIVIIIITTI